MYRSFSIRNFRCFRHLTVEPLERVNLIIGVNNVGKTALLEAMFLHLGANNPELPARLNAVRGIERVASDPGEVWGWLFFERRLQETVELTAVDEAQDQHSLFLRLADAKGPHVVSAASAEGGEGMARGSFAAASGPRQLVMEYRDEIQSASSFAYIVEGQIKAEKEGDSRTPPGIFLSTRARFHQEDAERFSRLEQQGRQHEVVAPLQAVEPRLRRLAVVVAGGLPVVAADVWDGRLVPLPYCGEGMVRLLSILCAIASAPRGMVLIDEIENGLHYSVLTRVWKAIADAARRTQTQVVATTHSWECIRAAHEAFVANPPYDFRLHRLDSHEGDIVAVSYDEAMLTAAIAAGLEVR